MTNYETLVPVVLVALLTLIGNILFFRYTFHKEGKKDLLRRKLTDFLLPLYFLLKKDELEIYAWLRNQDLDMYEYYSDMPKRLMGKELYEIISKNLYLADNELHTACLEFLVWGYSSNSYERFQTLHNSDNVMDVPFEQFRTLVYKKFNEVRNDYLKL